VDKEGIYQKLKRNPANIRFEELCKAAESFGFRFKGGRGSHRIFVSQGIEDMLNF